MPIIASTQEEKWESLRVRCPPLDALRVMQLRNIRSAQIESTRCAFAAGPFDALLVGTCGVQAWSAPLVRGCVRGPSCLRRRRQSRAETPSHVLYGQSSVGAFVAMVPGI